MKPPGRLQLSFLLFFSRTPGRGKNPSIPFAGDRFERLIDVMAAAITPSTRSSSPFLVIQAGFISRREEHLSCGADLDCCTYGVLFRLQSLWQFRHQLGFEMCMTTRVS